MDKFSRFARAYDYLHFARIIISQQDAATIMGTTQPNISSAYNGNPRVLTDRFIKRFCAAFPQISAEWVLSGNGEMLTDKGQTITNIGTPLIHISGSNNSGNNNSIYNNVAGAQQPPSQSNFVNLEERPLVPPEITRKPNLDVYEYVQTEDVKQKYPALALFPGVELYCNVLDDAMQPHYCVGDILALATFDPTRGTLVNGRPFVVSTNSVGFIFALVYDRGDCYECRPTNTNGVIETTMVQKSDVIRLYRVVGMMRLV